MHYAITCRDTPGSSAARQHHLEAHLAHVREALAKDDTLCLAGPLRDEAGAIVGSLLIVKADSADAARQWLECDPYHGAGIWGEIRIEPFVPAAGHWLGGVNW
ncbi:MAG: YciI family protein [Gammaproteobacteria bacterium]|nr:YciI family protein [Gammaproteobacteria bacterium]